MPHTSHGRSAFHNYNENNRYVYFSTLLHEQGDQLKNLGEDAAKDFSSIPTKSIVNLEKNKKIRNFTDFILEQTQAMQRIYEVLRTNEETFLKNHLATFTKQLNKIKNDNPNDIRIPALQMLKDFCNNKTKLDYPLLITGLNLLRTNSELYIENLNKIYEQLINQPEIDITKKMDKEVTQIYDDDIEITMTIQEELKDTLTRSYSAYRERLLQEYSNFTPLNDTLAQRQTDLLMSILNTIVSSANFIDDFTAKIQSSKIGTNYSSIIKNIISNAIITYNFSGQAEDIVKQILNDETLWKNYSSLPDMSTAWTENQKEVISVSFQELALTKGTQLATYFLQYLSKSQQQQFLDEKEYGKYLGEKIKSKLEAYMKGQYDFRTSSQAQSNLTRSLRNAILNKMKDDYAAATGEVRENLDGKTEQENKEIKQKLLATINTKKLIWGNDAIKKGLRISRIKNFDVAELQAATLLEIKKQNKNIQVSIPGHGFNLKDDVTYSIAFDLPDSAKKKIDLSAAAQKAIDSYLRKFKRTMNNFIQNYHKKGKGATNINEAKTEFLRIMKELGKKYQETHAIILKEIGDAKFFEEYVNNTFFGGISVKEYDFYVNEIGNKGGSLGGQFAVAEGINTIMAMYDTGGLSQADVDLLVYAAYNAGPSSTEIMDPDVIKQIKTMLLGGAVLAMFDEGFSPTQKILNQVEKYFGTKNTPKTLELLQVGSLIVPQSLVIQLVLKNLQEYIADIQLTIPDSMKNVNSSIEFSGQPQHQNDDKYEHAVYNKKKSPFHTAQERWDAVAAEAQQNTKMYILLISGLLDLLNSLPALINTSVKNIKK